MVLRIGVYNLYFFPVAVRQQQDKRCTVSLGEAIPNNKDFISFSEKFCSLLPQVDERGIPILGFKVFEKSWMQEDLTLIRQ